MLKVDEIRINRRNIWECDLCGREIDEPQRIAGGGRVTFCERCIRKLENSGYLARNGDGSLELKDSLFNILADYPTL